MAANRDIAIVATRIINAKRTVFFDMPKSFMAVGEKRIYIYLEVFAKLCELTLSFDPELGTQGKLTLGDIALSFKSNLQMSG
jgi:hypothetical protein